MIPPVVRQPPSTSSPARLAAFARLKLKHRRRRGATFGQELFADPAWDMLLDLFVAEVEGRIVSVKGLVLAAEVPESTAFRWVNTLIQAGLILRSPDPKDGRRHFVALHEVTRDGLERLLGTWLDETGALFDHSSG